MASSVTTKQASAPAPAAAAVSPAPRREASPSLSPGARSFAQELGANPAPLAKADPADKPASPAAPAASPAKPANPAASPKPAAPDRAAATADRAAATPDRSTGAPDRTAGAAAPDQRQGAPDPKTSPRDANAAVPVTVATAADDAPADAAASVKQLATGHRADVDNAPVVAFLTGHFERLDPAAIPSLIAGNEFLGAALGTADLGKFMNKASTVGDLLDALDLPETFVKDLKNLGLDLDTTVTPAELFRALGVDPAKAVAELKGLKNSLETGGVSALVKRAQAMHAPQAPQAPFDNAAALAANPGAKVDPAPVASTLKKAPAIGDLPRTNVGIDPSKAALPTGVPAAALSPQAAIAANASMTAAPQALTTPAAPAKSGQAGIAAVGAASLNQQAAQLPLQRLAAFDPQQMPDLLKVVDPAELAKVLPDPTAAAPQVNRATFDAFAHMGERLNGMDTQVLAAGQNAAAPMDPSQALMQAPSAAMPRSALDQMIQDALRGPGAGKTMPSIIPAQIAASGLLSPASAQDLASFLQKPEDFSVDAVDPSFVAKAAPLAGAVPGAMLQDIIPAGRKIAADDLKLVVPTAVTLDAGPAKGADKNTNPGDRDDERGDGNAADKFADMVRGHAPGAHAARHAGEAFNLGASAKAEAGALSPSERLDMMQKIVDRAASLSKEGGGVVRIDLGNADIGRLELAVKMTDDKVDLRILTSSDRARDIMAAELGRLRDALTVQQVQLGKVEVGVSGRNPNQNFSGFAQNFNQSFGQQQQNGAFQAQRELRDAAARMTPRRALDPAAARAVAPLAMNQNGRIQVRA